MKILLLTLLSLLLVSWSFAVEIIDLNQNEQLNQKIQQQQPRTDHTKFLRSFLSAGDEFTLKLLRQRTDTGNNTIYRYTQLHQGVPVFGQQIVIKEKEQRIVTMFGYAIKGIADEVASVTPALDAPTVLENMKTLQRGQSKESWRYNNEKTELVIYVTTKNQARLCYAVSFYANSSKGNPTRPQYLADAFTGEVVHRYENLQHDERTPDKGTGPGGNNKTAKYFFNDISGKYPSFDIDYTAGTDTSIMDCTKVKTVDLNHSEDDTLDTAFSYTGKENTHKEINGAFCPLNDAHFLGAKVVDLYQSWYGIPPLSFQLVMKVHYSTNYINAYWQGSYMVFGDGDGIDWYPLITADIVCHEVSHGFTEQHSNLVYMEESGGINESFSDIAGEALEFYVNGSNDFLVGRDLSANPDPNVALRYMDDPTKDGSSIGNYKDYYDGIDVHYSSGIYNKAFYTLCQTGRAWNTRKAFDIFVKANMDYWTPSTGFVQGAKAVLEAGKDLGYEKNDIIAAFSAVGIVLAIPRRELSDSNSSGGGCNSPYPSDGNIFDLLPYLIFIFLCLWKRW